MSGSGRRPRLDHVGIAVRSLAERLPAWMEAVGVEASGTEEVAGEQVRVAFLPVGETRLELLEPTGPGSTVARFLDRHGEGIHHLCLEVDSLEATLARLAAAGVRLIDASPRRGAGGSRVAFVHPAGMGGVLLELKERA